MTDSGLVTLPRMCIVGGTYLVTRTTANRRFLLKPSPIVSRCFLYCVARAARRHRMLLHALCVESTHYHLVVTDPHGELSEFVHWLDRHVARCLLEHYDQTHPHQHLDGIWSKDHFSATLLLTPEAVLDAVVYTLTNPQKDGLVREYRQWPGLHTTPRDWLLPARYAPRPELFFDQHNVEFAQADYQFVIPPQFADREPESLARDVETLVEDKQRAVHASMAAQGRTFLGAARIMRADPFDAPTSKRLKGTMNPRFAGGGNHEAMSQAVQALRLFRERYRQAWIAFCKGIAAVFPAGTLLMRRRFNVPCEPLDTPWCIRAPALT
jgi:putative transposase